MCGLETFKIDLKSLEEGGNTLIFRLDNDYFKAIEASDIRGGDVHVNMSIHRSEDVFTCNFRLEGTVIIPCTLCLEDMEQRIVSDRQLLVKFGTEDLEDDELITVDKHEGILDVAWLIYEFVALEIPIKHVHDRGKCNPTMVEMMERFTPHRAEESHQTKAIDPRWSELEKLKTIIKD